MSRTTYQAQRRQVVSPETRAVLAAVESIQQSIREIEGVQDTIHLLKTKITDGSPEEVEFALQKLNALTRNLRIEKTSLLGNLQELEPSAVDFLSLSLKPETKKKEEQQEEYPKRKLPQPLKAAIQELSKSSGIQSFKEWAKKPIEDWIRISMDDTNGERITNTIRAIVEDNYKPSYSGNIQRSWKIFLTEPFLVSRNSHGAIFTWLREQGYFGHPPILTKSGERYRVAVKTPKPDETLTSKQEENYFQLVLYK